MAEKIASYLLGLLEEILGPSRREVRFDWCRGDPSGSRPRGVPLPYDACWPELRLIVEVNENQHREPVTHFDKPDKLTVSGVHRGIQRHLYDERKASRARENGYTLLNIAWTRDRRDRVLSRDRAELLAQLDALGIRRSTEAQAGRTR